MADAVDTVISELLEYFSLLACDCLDAEIAASDMVQSEHFGDAYVLVAALHDGTLHMRVGVNWFNSAG